MNELTHMQIDMAVCRNVKITICLVYNLCVIRLYL